MISSRCRVHELVPRKDQFRSPEAASDLPRYRCSDPPSPHFAWATNAREEDESREIHYDSEIAGWRLGA